MIEQFPNILNLSVYDPNPKVLVYVPFWLRLIQSAIIVLSYSLFCKCFKIIYKKENEEIKIKFKKFFGVKNDK